VTGKFLDSGASSATKLDLDVKDTPFSVASYSDDFLKAIETTSVSDLYRYMTGVQRAGNTGYDITLRGFKTSGNDRNSILTDGLPGLSVRFGSPPTIGVDHIEVVKGPTSVLYGQAQPGGFINIITKKPLRRERFEFGLRGNKGIGKFDSAKGFLASVDVTGPIDSEGRFLYRFVGEAGDTEGFRDFSFEHPVYVAPGLTWNIGEQTALTLQGEHRNVRTHYDTYLVAPLRNVDLIADIDTSYQDREDFLLERGTIGTVNLRHEFSDSIKFNAGYRYVDHYDYAQGHDAVGFRNSTTLTRRARKQENVRTYGFGDANISAKFETFGIEHQGLVGGSFGRETASLNRLQFFNAPATGAQSLDINIYNPVYRNPPLDFYPIVNPNTPGNLTWRYSTQKSLGAYVSDLMTFSEQWKLMLGLRYADEKQTIVERRIAGTPDQAKADTAWLPLAGLIFQPTKDISIYASYSTSFVPVPASNQDIFGSNPFKPTKANSIEAGVKADLFDGKLNTTLAVYEIKKKDTINTFTCPTSVAQAISLGLLPSGFTLAPGQTLASGTCSAAIGGERSRGFEIEVNASPLPGWQLTAGYAHTEARVTDSNILRQIGSRLTNSPDDAFNLWSRYDFSGALQGFGIGLGIAYIGDRTGFIPAAAVPAGVTAENELLPLPSYTTVDLGLYYQASENVDMTLKVTNLFDQRYIESAGFTADIQLVPGTPRYATLTIRFTL
jgi:iron complex outermembrane receptor protein